VSAQVRRRHVLHRRSVHVAAPARAHILMIFSSCRQQFEWHRGSSRVRAQLAALWPAHCVHEAPASSSVQKLNESIGLFAVDHYLIYFRQTKCFKIMH
jgi:LSD1 subclass zinc finger protein